VGCGPADAHLEPRRGGVTRILAAFYAVSALFAAEGHTFTRHSALETAVHRDLVSKGRWGADLGAVYTRLVKLRETGDYGGGRHVTQQEASQAVETAHAILEAVRKAQPDHFRVKCADA